MSSVWQYTAEWKVAKFYKIELNSELHNFTPFFHTFLDPVSYHLMHAIIWHNELTSIIHKNAVCLSHLLHTFCFCFIRNESGDGDGTNNTIPWLTFLMIGGGGSKYYSTIYWPPPPTNVQVRHFVNGIQELSKTFTYHRQYYPWLTFLFNGWRGGQNIMV